MLSADRWFAMRHGVWSTSIAVISVVRGAILFLSGRPRTPLRALCIVGLDTLRRLRGQKRLANLELQNLAALLDFQARVNAALDDKVNACHECERRVAYQRLEDAGLGAPVAEYQRRLADLETRRPRPGGDGQRFAEVRGYREAVVRLSLAMVATAADGSESLDETIEATHDDGPHNLLFRIAMQCQIIDDVLDYAEDRSAGLPSFLTACDALAESTELTRGAAVEYADAPAQAADLFPLRVGLVAVSRFAKLVLAMRPCGTRDAILRSTSAS
jgi:hypothetical protein